VSNYRFCKVSLQDGALKFTVGEEDVNWAAQDMETIRRTFRKENWLEKYAPWIMFAVTIIIIMIILMSLFNKFTVMKDISDNLIKVTEAQIQITEMLVNNTAIINTHGVPIITPSGVG
jgi:hypothetical protein